MLSFNGVKFRHFQSRIEIRFQKLYKFYFTVFFRNLNLGTCMLALKNALHLSQIVDCRYIAPPLFRSTYSMIENVEILIIRTLVDVCNMSVPKLFQRHLSVRN